MAEHWPADQVERRPIGSLVPNARNARTHTEEQVQQVAAAIREWGWTIPVLVDERDQIIAGHARIMAAQTLGIREVPVVVARGWTEKQKQAFLIADNQLALAAGWDRKLLVSELEALGIGGFALGLTGFSQLQLDRLLRGTKGRTDPDDAPAAPARPTSRHGDVWLLGRHRIVCGDSTSEATVAAALAGARPPLMVTDPPYGVEYDATWRVAAGVNKPWQKRAEGKVANDERADWTPVWQNFPGAIAYVWHGGLHASEVAASLQVAGFLVRSQIIWAKQALVIGRGHYHWQHEPCWYAVRKGKDARWCGDRSQCTLWEVPNTHPTQGDADDMRTPHSTQKPVEVMRRPILNHLRRGEIVFDPFLGSGSTLIAAESCGRRCYGIEIECEYVDLVIARFQALTKQQARLEGGKTYDLIAKERTQKEKRARKSAA